MIAADGAAERDRLAQTLGSAGATPASRIWTEMASGHIEDDVTIISLRRP
ncbi:hypothetical protein [Mycobacterium sp. 852014-50255_SCH5639931]|nr:hypothetical protein [Mycobacterium sp. 852014-50255_SCH5639931]